VSKNGLSSGHEAQAEVAVGVDQVPVSEDGHVVQEVLPAFQSVDRMLRRRERDLRAFKLARVQEPILDPILRLRFTTPAL
jgi:hypothetical protein